MKSGRRQQDVKEELEIRERVGAQHSLSSSSSALQGEVAVCIASPQNVQAQNSEENRDQETLERHNKMATKVTPFAVLQHQPRHERRALTIATQQHAEPINGNKPIRAKKISLHQAVADGNLTDCDDLIADGRDINRRNGKTGRTPLHLAAKLGRGQIVLLLLEAGADDELCDSLGCSALHHAAANCHVDVIEALIDVGADVSITAGEQCHKWQPVMFAASKGHTDAVGALLSVDSNIAMAKDSEGMTAEQIARNNGHNDCANVLAMAAEAYRIRSKHEEEAEKVRKQNQHRRRSIRRTSIGLTLELAQVDAPSTRSSTMFLANMATSVRKSVFGAGEVVSSAVTNRRLSVTHGTADDNNGGGSMRALRRWSILRAAGTRSSTVRLGVSV